MSGQHAPGYGSSRTFRQKLGIYLLGIAIGLILFGWFQMRKRQAAAYQQRAVEPDHTAQPPSDSPGTEPPSPADG